MINGLMKRKYNRLMNEKAGKEIIIWNKKSQDSEEAKVGDYTLVADRVIPGKFAWEVWYNSEIVAMGDINGDCTTTKFAKDKAAYRMRRHKQLMKVKTANYAN